EGDVMRLGEVARGLTAALGLRWRRIQLRCVEMREDGDDARRLLRVGGVDRLDRATGDRRRHDDGVHDASEVVLRRVAGAARDLGAAVDAVAWRADHAAPPTRSVSARTSVRLASSIL